MLLNFAPLIKPAYRNYCGAHARALSTIDQTKKLSPAFTAFLEETSKRPEMERLSLDSILIMPCQRVPRYELLINDLRKFFC